MATAPVFICFAFLLLASGVVAQNFWLQEANFVSLAWQNPNLATSLDANYFPPDNTSVMIFGNTINCTVSFFVDALGIANQNATIVEGIKYRIRFWSSNSLVSFNPLFIEFTNTMNDTVVIASGDVPSVTIYAQNPSSSEWFAPEGNDWTPDSTAIPARATWPWTAYIACMFPDGSDCAASACPGASSFVGGDGFCYQPITSLLDDQITPRPALPIAPRPLTLYSVFNPSFFALPDLSAWPVLSDSAYPGSTFRSYVITLPVANASASVSIIGSVPDRLRQFYPGLDNSGGTITLDVWKTYWKSKSTGKFNETTALQINWAGGTQQLSFDSNSKSFSISLLPGGADVAGYRIYFRVSAESNASVITPSNNTQNSSQGVYRSGAYMIPYLDIMMKNVSLFFVNFPPANGIIYVTIVSPPTELYSLVLDLSPAALGLASVSFPFTLTPTGVLSIWSNGVAVDPATGFVFNGYNRVITFGLVTQNDGPVSFDWGTPVTSGGSTVAVFQLPSGFAATLNVDTAPPSSTITSSPTSVPSSSATQTDSGTPSVTQTVVDLHTPVVTIDNSAASAMHVSCVSILVMIVALYFFGLFM